MPTPGMLYVAMQPKKGLPLEQFHDWYNNEHGPARLRLPHIFTNGLRYRATDGQEPEYLAAYDVTDMPHLETEVYTKLRANRSTREADTIAQVDVNRVFYDLIHTRKSPAFVPFQDLTDEEAGGIVTVAVSITTTDAEGAGDQLQKWFEEEHAPLLSKVPGWLRSRMFKTSTLEGVSKPIYVSLHDYAKTNGLGGPEHKASMDTPWRTEVFDKYVAAKGRRTYSLFYVFGPAPRDLDSLSKRDPSAAFTSDDKKTSSSPGPLPVISSYITTPDELAIPYRLEGNPSLDAPTIAFSNSLLTSMHMWDRFVAILKKERPDLRILRYDTRGRHQIPHPLVDAKMGMLADDLRTLLDALRIRKLDTLMGVSMGGSTTLNFAIKYPDRLRKFVACDCNYQSTEANTKAWGERTVVAREQGIRTLAEMTVDRWFHPATLENKEVTNWMYDHVAENDVEGFAHSCTALCDFNLKSELDGCNVPCLLVAGEGDGKGAIAKILAGVKDTLGPNGAELRLVPNAGHLPMYETPQAFWDAVKDYI